MENHEKKNIFLHSVPWRILFETSIQQQMRFKDNDFQKSSRREAGYANSKAKKKLCKSSTSLKKLNMHITQSTKKQGGHMFQSNTCEIITQNWFLRKRGKEPRREGPGFDSRHSLIVFFSRILTTITKTTTKALNGHLCVYE